MFQLQETQDFTWLLGSRMGRGGKNGETFSVDQKRDSTDVSAKQFQESKQGRSEVSHAILK